MNALEHALQFAARGIPVCRVEPNGKDPYRGGVNEATTDAAVIRRWFEAVPDLNYGVATGGPNGIVVTDVDPRHNPAGWVEEFLSLGPLPKTLRVTTPSGGEHIYFAGVQAGQRKLKGTTSIDVRGVGGYVVGPGSVVQGKRWRITVDAPLSPCPPAIAARLSKPGEKAEDNTTPLCDLDMPGALMWAEAFLTDKRGATKGERNATLHRLAGVLKDKGVSRETCLELLTEHWCPKCEPPYANTDQIEKTVDSAYTNGVHPPGCDAPELQFEDVSGEPALLEADRKGATGENIAPAARIAPVGVLERLGDIHLAALVERQSGALVKGILHPRDCAVLYGESMAGKSFVGLDLSWHIACGMDWHGRKVNRAPVLYVALEGVDGFRKRMLAIGAVHGDPGLWFARLNLPIVSLRNTKDGEKGRNAIVAACKRLEMDCGQPVGLVVIDTYARATAGDSENDTDAVMNFVQHRSGFIGTATAAAVLTIAHTNRAGDLRGSLHLRNSADVVLKAVRNEDQRTLVGEKIKDGAECTLFDFTLEEVDLARDADGEPVSSCVIRTTPPQRREKVTGPQKRLLQAFETVRVNEQADEVTLAAVREQFMSTFATGEPNPEKAGSLKRSAWSKAKNDLPPGLEIGIRDGVEYIRRKGAGSDPVDEFEAFEA